MRTMCRIIHGDSTGKVDEKTKIKSAVRSPVIMLTYLQIAIA